MGDLNCELQRYVQGYTGKWCMNTRKDNGHGEEILVLMQSFDLFVVDTLFKPERKYGDKENEIVIVTLHTLQNTQKKDRGNLIMYVCRTGGKEW